MTSADGWAGQVLVLGVGNLLLGDEGVGVQVAQELLARGVPEGVEVRDAGTAGLELVEELSEGRRVIVVDALEAGLAPGTVRVFRPEEVQERESMRLSSLHGIGILEVYHLARQLGRPADVTVIGVQVERVAPSLELSATLRAQWQHILERVDDEINRAVSPRAEAAGDVAIGDQPSGGS